MKRASKDAFIQTIGERCRVCFTCVRECPAKAIRIVEGQAEVIGERCIACGNCVRVCSQHAKQVRSSVGQVEALLASPATVAACIAPSFPAEFTEYEARQVVGMLRALGFDLVNEVAFGADLVARAYRDLLEKNRDQRYISTACPAIIGYVERYHPDLVEALAPIVSPMVAQARALHCLHGEDLKIVFIGPCIAKKLEAESENIPGEVDAVLTFVELRELFEERGVAAREVPPGTFDPPRAGLGMVFPISRGLLEAAHIHEDLMAGEIVATDGRSNFVQAIKEFESGDLNARLLEILACTGCIMGAGMSSTSPLFSRRSRVSQYVRECMAQWDEKRWRGEMERFGDLDLARTFSKDDQRLMAPSREELTRIMARMGKMAPEDELNCGACGYDTCRDHAIAIHKGMAESEMCLPHTIDQLRETVGNLAISDEQLAQTREALMQSEKLASMGQLAAGIAHELNNPLGVVLMYAHLLLDEVEKDTEIEGDLKMVAEQADRCKKIVGGLLHFARQNKVVRQPINVCKWVDRSLKSLPAPGKIAVRIEHDLDDPIAELDRDQVAQVLTNLVSNAYAAMGEEGMLTVRTEGNELSVRLIVRDTGVGIPKENLTKIFEPFFTTKQIGKGTGLGLAVTYGIVKMHSGDIRVQSNADPEAGPTGTTFTVTLPRQGGTN